MARKSSLGIEGTGVSFIEPNQQGRKTCALIRVADEQGVYQGRRFPVTSWRRDGTPVVPQEAIDWARETRKTFIRGEATAGTADFGEWADRLIIGLGKSVDPERISLIRNVKDGLIAAGLRDMKSPRFAAGVKAWLNSLKTGWHQPATYKFKHKNPRPLAPATYNKTRTIVLQVVQLAKDQKCLATNPIDSDLCAPLEVPQRLKALFTVDDLRRLVSDEARDHAVIAKQKLLDEIAQQGTKRMEAFHAVAAKRGVHWTTICGMLRRPALPDPWWLPCCLMVYTGARAGQAMHLRWEWFKWDEGIITMKLIPEVATKEDRERLVPIEPELRDILFPMAKPNGFILPDHIRRGSSGARLVIKQEKESTNTPYGSRDYADALRRYAARVGVDVSTCTPHCFRHGMATLKLARDDCNPDRVRKALGHMSARVTAGYAEQSQRFQYEVDTWPDRSLWLRRLVPAGGRKREMLGI